MKWKWKTSRDGLKIIFSLLRRFVEHDVTLSFFFLFPAPKFLSFSVLLCFLLALIMTLNRFFWISNHQTRQIFADNWVWLCAFIFRYLKIWNEPANFTTISHWRLLQSLMTHKIMGFYDSSEICFWGEFMTFFRRKFLRYNSDWKNVSGAK